MCVSRANPLFFVRRPSAERRYVIYIRKPEEIAGHLQQRGIPMPAKLFLETDSISYNEYRRYEKIFDPRVVCNGTQLLRGVRSIKTIYEIGRIMRSGVLHARLYERIPSLYRPGMTDTELSIDTERESRGARVARISGFSGRAWEDLHGEICWRGQCRCAVAVRFRARRGRSGRLASGRRKRYSVDRRNQRDGRYGREFHRLYDRHDPCFFGRKADRSGL